MQYRWLYRGCFFVCRMLIVVIVVVAIDYIVFSKLHADIS